MSLSNTGQWRRGRHMPGLETSRLALDYPVALSPSRAESIQ